MLKLWWGAPEGDLLSLAWQVRPPPHFPHSLLHRSGLYIYIGSALWNIRQILRWAPLGRRYHRALCLERRDDRIWRISKASNVKEPTCFMVTSWIVRSDGGHDSAIRSVFLFCYRTSTSARMKRRRKKHFIVCQNRVFTTLFDYKTSIWLLGEKRLIAKLIRDNFYMLCSFQFFSNFRFEWKHDKIYLPTINKWYMLCLKSLDH